MADPRALAEALAGGGYSPAAEFTPRQTAAKRQALVDALLGKVSGAVDWWRSQPSFLDRMTAAHDASERARAGRTGLEGLRAAMNDPEARRAGLDVAGDFAFAGMSDVINLRATLERRMLEEFRKRNLAELAEQGYYGTTQLSNGWSIGRYVGPG